VSLVTTSIHIDAPPRDVWQLIMDAQRLGDWVTIHRGLGHVDTGPLRIGYRMDQHVHLRGVSLDVHWTLVECVPCVRAVWRGRGPARSHAHTEYALRPENGGTRFDYRNEFRTPFGPIGAIVSRALVGGIPKREAERTLERLRAQLE
jgi:carbon monoxide dehydrogenase subunit G